MSKLPPLVFELHTDQATGQSGLIQAPGSNPVFDALTSTYGAPWDPANYGAPKMNVSLLELSATPASFDAATVDAAAQKLYGSLMGVPNVASGARPLHFFAGHGDLTTGQTGAPGEKEYVKAVKLRLKEIAKNNPNFHFHESILDPNDTSRTSGDETTTNWGRGRAIVAGTSDYTPVSMPVSDTSPPPANDTVVTSETPQQQAVERSTNYKEMSKQALNAEYDRLRAESPDTAAAEGMKMHMAYFGKE